QITADQKNSFGRGKNETNMSGYPGLEAGIEEGVKHHNGSAGLANRRHPSFQAGKKPHNSRALEKTNDDIRRVFSSRIKVRVIGGSARWLQFSRSHSRQLTPIGAPSAVSRLSPPA